MRDGTKMKTVRRGRPRTFDERLVLDQITDLFWHRGLAGTSLDAISTATGLARPSLYTAFGNKEAMYRASFRNFVARVDAEMTDIVQSPGSVQSVLLRIFDVLVRLYTHEHSQRGCFVLCTATAAASENADIRGALRDMLEHVDSRFTRVLEQAKHRNDLSPDTDVPALGAVLAAISHTIAVRARAGITAEELRALANAMVPVVMGPYLHPG